MKKNLLLALLVATGIALVIVAQRGWLAVGRPGAIGSGTVRIIDLQGKPINLEEYRGKVVVLNFWATWCAPCLIEIPWMIGFQEKYAARGFTVLGVAMDDEGRSVVEPWVNEKQFDLDGRQTTINYPILVGTGAAAEQFGGLLGFPTTLLISRDGQVVKRIIGLASHDVLVKEIEALL